MRTLTASLVLVMALQGCAYQQAMKHGETAAASQQWGSAYDAYRFANEVKPGAADAQVADARAEVVGSELVAAEKAVSGKDYVKAADHLDNAAHVDVEDARIAPAREAAREALHADLASRMEALDETDISETYAFVASAKTMYPDSPEIEDSAETLRARIVADARAQIDQGEHDAARTTARLIGELEPAHRSRGDVIDQEVTAAWVADLVAQAKAAERRHPGLAAVHWTRAHEVGGDAEHREAIGASLEAAGAGAALGVFVDTKGSGGRHWRVRKTVRAGLEDVAGVKPGSTSKWDLKATVSANSERCTETKEAKPISKEYVSGTKQVPNPAHAEVSEALTAAKADLKTVDTELDEVRAAHGTAKAETEAKQGERGRKLKLHEDAVKTLDATKEQITASAERVKEVEAELKALEGGDQSVIDKATEQLALLQGFHTDWKEKQTTDEQGVAEAKGVLDALDAELKPAEAEVERLTASLADAETRHEAAEKKAAALVAKRQKTDKELTEDVLDVAKVDETTWTLACAAPATVFYSTRWDTEREKKQTIDAKTFVTDVERPAHEGAEIEGDSKEYAKSKEELIAELDATSDSSIAKELEAFVAESFDQRLSGALAAESDVGAATHTLVQIATGAPERVDAETRKKIIEHLKSHYGISDAALLGVEAAPPAAEEAGGAADDAPADAETPDPEPGDG